MHRVELKDTFPNNHIPPLSRVPNAPCGVESYKMFSKASLSILKFLMHRVELKAVQSRIPMRCSVIKFLMHRVELKGLWMILWVECFCPVPNAPCGVERPHTKLHTVLLLTQRS